MTKPRSEKELVREHERSLRRWDAFETLGKWLICGLAAVCLGYVLIALPVKYSAGQQTAISYALNWAQNVKVDVAFAWATAGGASVWAVYERRKRLRERQEKDSRLIRLEKVIDPSRTSSGLRTDGGDDGREK